MRFKLTIEYAGTRYSGWQIQKNARTVQGELDRAIRDATGAGDFELYGAGRTDTVSRDYAAGWFPRFAGKRLENDPATGKLLRHNPFPDEPPRLVRACLFRDRFATHAERRATGQWWRRQFLGLYAPVLERGEDGRVTVVQFPEIPPRE